VARPAVTPTYFFSSLFSSVFASGAGVEAAGADSAGAAVLPVEGEDGALEAGGVLLGAGAEAEGVLVLVEVDAPLPGALSWPQAASANAADTASSSALFIHVL
jgi:hypothetical protein